MFMISCNIVQMFYKSIKEYNNKHCLVSKNLGDTFSYKNSPADL